MDARSPPPEINKKRPPTEKTHDDREPQPTHDAYPVFRSQDCPPESVKLGNVTQLANGHILGCFTFTPTSAWGCEWQAVLVGETPPPLSREYPQKKPAQQFRPTPAEPVQKFQPLPGENENASCGSDRMKDDNPEPQPTHDAFAVNRSQGYPPEWVRLGPVTQLKNGHIMGRFTSAPTSGWSWKWLAVPIGEEPPPLSAEPPPARTAQQSRPVPAEPAPEFEPLPGEEDEPRGFFSGGDETS